jgi:hypothetical protein
VKQIKSLQHFRILVLTNIHYAPFAALMADLALKIVATIC